MATWQRSIQSRRGPPPPEYTCCHHLSVARRHSLSQQMRGLSERAPQFLRDAGEQGGSRHARLWFLPTARTDRTGSLGASSVAFGCWNFGRRATCAQEGGVFLLGRAKVLVLVSFFVIMLFWNLFEIIEKVIQKCVFVDWDKHQRLVYVKDSSSLDQSQFRPYIIIYTKSLKVPCNQ